MMGIQEVLLSVSNTNSNCYDKLEVRRVGLMMFQLKSGGSLKMAVGMHVLELSDFPSVSTLEDYEYSMVVRDGQSLLYSEGATFDAAARHGIKQDTLYRLLGQPCWCLCCH